MIRSAEYWEGYRDAIDVFIFNIKHERALRTLSEKETKKEEIKQWEK